MKKFEQIQKYMDSNKSKPIEETPSIDFLPANKFLYHADKNYAYETIIKFFAANHILLKDFYSIGKVEKDCTGCGKNKWLVWRNEFMYYDTLNKCFINIEDDEELEPSPELEEIDFAVYVCSQCGVWSTSISNSIVLP